MKKRMPKLKNVEPLSPELQARLKALIDVQGLSLARVHLGKNGKMPSRQTLERASDGHALQLGTAALLRERFAQRDAEGKTP